MSQEYQHLTTEQLSACIDKQLSIEEQSLVDEHLKQCEQCQLWLQELRATIRLVHALPQPQLPRSFVLPVDVLVAPLPAQTEQTGHITTVRHTRPSRMWSVISAASAIAAMIGLVFILSGLLFFSHGASSAITAAPSAGSSSSAATTSGVSKQTPQYRQAMTPRALSTAMATSISQATASFALRATATAVAVPKSQPIRAPGSSSPGSSASLVAFLDPSQSSGRVAIGILLVMLGCAGLIYQRIKFS